MELNLTLQPRQREALKVAEITPVTFYGGAKGGGKSYLVRARELYRRLRQPNSKGLIVRKTYPELLSNHIRMFLKEYPQTKDWFKQAEKAIYYPNGSITEFSYLRTTNDVYTYQGRDYEDISVDEITQHEWEVIRVLRSSNRTTIKGFLPTMFLTGNPGGIGHQEVKRIFIDRVFREGENPGDYAFVQAFVADNQALMEADPNYINRLQDLPEHLRKAYLEGDWNIFAGQAFAEMSYQTHVVEPFELPADTRYIAGYDHGYNHPFSFVLAGIVPDGTVYITQHYTDRLKNVYEIAEGIKEHLRGRKVTIYAGHDLWYPGRGGGASVYEQFRDLGLNSFVRAKIDRGQGVAQIRKYITYRNSPDNKPLMFFFKTEPVLRVFDTVAGMQFDDKKPEDVMKMDADENGQNGDDSYDSLRYMLMSRATPGLVEKQKPKSNTKEEMMQWIQKRGAIRKEYDLA